jgi:hypothetical protein
MARPEKAKAPAVEAGASVARELAEGRSPFDSFTAWQVQWLIAAHHLGPELAAMLAGAVLGRAA